MGYNSRMDLKNSPSTGGPSKVILVTGAVCLSVILASVSYKITLSSKNKSSENIIVGSEGTTTNPTSLITNALQDAQMASLEEANTTSSSPFAIKSEDSVSDRLTKTIFTGYQYAQQADGVTDDSVSQVNDAVFSQIKTSDIPQGDFLLSQVRVFVPKTKSELRDYGNSLADIIVSNYQLIADNPDKYLDNLTNLSKIYNKIGSTIILQKSPIAMQTTQLNLANSYNLTGKGMDMVADQNKDPVKAMLGLKTVKELNTYQIEMLINIANYLNNNDIIFTSNEPGFFWNQYVNVTLPNEQTSLQTSN
jgi:hypothetical protein